MSSPQSADVNARTNKGETPLHMVSLRRDEEGAKICKALIEVGADVEARDNKGQTALHRAASVANYNICLLLIGAGADVEARDNEDQIPFDLLPDAKKFNKLMKKLRPKLH